MPPQLLTLLTAMLPITELRVSIPLAIQFWGLSPAEAFFWGTLGNIIPNFLILAFLEPISKFLSKHFKFFDKFFTWFFTRTRQKHNDIFNRVGAVFLVTFIAIPIPGTGSWTGSLIAWLFGVPYWKAIALVTLGVLGSGLIVTAGYTSILTLFNIFTN